MNQLYKNGYLSGLVVEEREPHIPEPPPGLDPTLSNLFTNHFRLRAEAESMFFNDPDFPRVPTLQISREELNSVKVHNFISESAPDLCISYGVHILSKKTLKVMECPAWNIHGGLSPEYKGRITHFWPSYMLEPQMTGVTLHEITPKIDAGAIIHQTSADLVRGDGLHKLSCRTIKKFSKEILRVLKLFALGKLKLPRKQRKNGKLWLYKDWRPEHLRVIYEQYNDKIVDLYLEGKIKQIEPQLVRQFP
jgi:methionyl-tRNA formyltransferase